MFTSTSLLTGVRRPADVRRQLDRWVKSGRVLRLRRGVYAVAPPHAERQAHPFVVANALPRASYVSLESALAFYGMIPEHVPVTTSVTTRRPESLDTPLGRFVFRHVKPSLFFGFAEEQVAPEQRAVLALPEKALVDLLYLTPASDRVSFLIELRLERSGRFDVGLFQRMAARTGSRKVRRAAEKLVRLWEGEKEGVVL